MPIIEAFECWLRSQQPKFDLEAHRVTRRNPHAWEDRVFITVSGELPGYKQAVQKDRSNAHGRLGSLFKRWQADKKSFDEVFEFESPGMQRRFFKSSKKSKANGRECDSSFAFWTVSALIGAVLYDHEHAAHASP